MNESFPCLMLSLKSCQWRRATTTVPSLSKVNFQLQRWIENLVNGDRPTRGHELRCQLKGVPIHILAAARFFFFFLKEKAGKK
jgi:hypothetical protein